MPQALPQKCAFPVKRRASVDHPIKYTNLRVLPLAPRAQHIATISSIKFRPRLREARAVLPTLLKSCHSFEYLVSSFFISQGTGWSAPFSEPIAP